MAYTNNVKWQRCCSRMEKSYFYIQNGSYAKISFVVSDKKECLSRVNLCLGSMHIGPLTALPGQQLPRKKVKTIAVTSQKIKLMLSSQASIIANNSAQLATTTAVTNVPRSHHTILLANGGDHQTASYETHSQLLARFNLPFLTKQLLVSNERTNEETNNLLAIHYLKTPSHSNSNKCYF